MGIASKIAIKNLIRNRKRTIATITGIILAIQLLTVVASLYTSGIRSLDESKRKNDGNFHVCYHDVEPNEFDIIKQNRKIEDISICQCLGYSESSEKVTALNDTAYKNLIVNVKSGRLPKNDNEVVVLYDTFIKGEDKLKVGNRLSLDIGKIQINKEENNVYEENKQELEDNEEYNNKIRIEDPIHTEYEIVGWVEINSDIMSNSVSNVNNDNGSDNSGYEGYDTSIKLFTYKNDDNINDKANIYVRYNNDGIKQWKNITRTIGKSIGMEKEDIESVINKEHLGYGNNPQMYEREIQLSSKLTINYSLVELEENMLFARHSKEYACIMLLVIIIITVVVVMYLKNSFDISIVGKTKQYGMLRSVGATKKQIVKVVLVEATIFIIVSIPVGILCGIFTSELAIEATKFYFGENIRTGFEMNYYFSKYNIIASFLLGMIVVYFSVLLSIRKAYKITPINAIRDNKTVKKKRFGFFFTLIRKIFGVSAHMALTNLICNRKRNKFSINLITITLALIIISANMSNIMFDYIEKESKREDLWCSINDYEKVYEDTKNLEEVEKIALFRTMNVASGNIAFSSDYKEYNDKKIIKNIYDGEVDQGKVLLVCSLGEIEYKDYVKSLGLDYNTIKDKVILNDYISLDKENVIQDVGSVFTNKDKKSFRTSEFKEGDSVDIEYTTNAPDDIHKESFEIACVTKERPFAVKVGYNNLLIVSDELFDKYFMDTEGAIESINTSLAYKSSDPRKLKTYLNKYLQRNDVLQEVYLDKEKTSGMVKSIVYYIFGFIIVMFLISCMSLINTIYSNIELRQKEFATYRSVGMSIKQLKRMLRTETFLTVIKSICLGIGIGLGTVYGINQFMNRGLFDTKLCKDYNLFFILYNNTLLGEIEYKINLPIKYIVGVVVFIIFIISLTLFFSTRKVKKQSIIESIRNENI